MGQSHSKNGSMGLEASGISKWFSNVPALRRVSIAVRPGQIVGLAGHNGAGKSTLLKVLSGVIQPDEGTVLLNGVRAELHSPAVALSKGIATVHQELSLLPNLTVTQNVFLARERTRMGMLQLNSMQAEARDMVKRFGLDIDVDRAVESYPVATRQLLELAIATHRNAQYLLLDEPTSSLEGEQVDKLLATIRSLANDQAVGILFINHKLDELYAVSDHIVALMDGEMSISGPAKSVAREDVVRAIAGEEAVVMQARVSSTRQAGLSSAADSPQPGLGGSDKSVSSGTAALSVKHLKTDELEDVNLTMRAGRVLGIYGLVGSGRSGFLRTLIGIQKVHSGEIKLFGETYLPRNPAQARKCGLVYLTEERKLDGIIAPLDAIINVSLPILDRFRHMGFLNRREMSRRANEYLDALKVRGHRTLPVTNLSGGNQQKTLLARALAQDPKVMLLDEPTKGVDIGVKVDIHHMIRELAHKKGLTIILVSSEEEEILEVADDVAVFIGGRCDGHTELAQNLTATQLRRIAWTHG